MRRRLMRRAPIAAAALLVAFVAAFLVLRDSSTFAVEEVEVVGASGPDAPRVESALRAAALEMTTLNADGDRLVRAVRAYPTVRGVELDRDPPHRLRVRVVERRPVAVVETGGRRVPLAADGRLLQGATPPEDVPSLALTEPPGRRVDDRRGRGLVALVAAAPSALRRRAARASVTDRGLMLTMDRGPDLIFGSADDLAAKWKAAARVLADPTAEGATYVDVRVPERAVAGGLAPLVEPGPPETMAPADPAAPIDPAAPARPTAPSPTA